MEFFNSVTITVPGYSMRNKLGLIFLLISLSGLQACTHLLFAPMKQHLLTPAQINVEYSDFSVRSSDGVMLHGWHLPAVQPLRGSVLFLHGNGENISTHLATVYWLPSQGFEVFMFDYRGYGLSQGVAGLEGSARDVEAALEYAMRHKASAHKLIVMGHSFGGSIGIYGVANSPQKHDIASVITIGAFSDYRGVTRDVLSRSWLTWPFQWPLSLTINNDFSPQRFVGKIAPVPILLMHSEQDQIVPYYHASVLYEHASQPKILMKIEGDHNHIFRSESNRQLLLDYLKQLK
ncbi:MAG: alpha/beta hydrolase [Gammaproteobacteria bacterium]|nr:MAG: alpha/beta hydrolase [Gammaproteobacteria bacterium]